VAKRLSTFLGDPAVCFHGSPIYQEDSDASNNELPLSHIKVGQHSHIVRVEADEGVRSFLADEGLNPGVELTINAISSSGVLLLETSTGKQVTMTKNIAEKTIVEASLAG
jgi:Fe2+ transport system protein FeoA